MYVCIFVKMHAYICFHHMHTYVSITTTTHHNHHNQQQNHHQIRKYLCNVFVLWVLHNPFVVFLKCECLNCRAEISRVKALTRGISALSFFPFASIVFFCLLVAVQLPPPPSTNRYNHHPSQPSQPSQPPSKPSPPQPATNTQPPQPPQIPQVTE